MFYRPSYRGVLPSQPIIGTWRRASFSCAHTLCFNRSTPKAVEPDQTLHCGIARPAKTDILFALRKDEVIA